MPDNGSTRREKLTIAAFDPKTGETCEVQISHQRMQVVARRSPGQVKECGFLVPMILQQKVPIAIFEGLRRDEDEDPRGVGWRCYCGLPEFSYTDDGVKKGPRPGKVFLVFVNDEGVAYNWRWEWSDPDEALLPMDHEDRFKERIL